MQCCAGLKAETNVQMTAAICRPLLCEIIMCDNDDDDVCIHCHVCVNSHGDQGT